jgi:peptide-methionine (S)-S-oxide reductase
LHERAGAPVQAGEGVTRLAKFLVAAAVASSAPASASPRLETAVLAGGCFWGMEAVFEHVKGVTSVVSGYAGGSAADASYAKVSSERTGHAEAVRISFDPAKVSYGDLLKIYFTIAHDPTQVNRQGPDTGPSYRSAIFPADSRQKALAERVIAFLKGKGVKVGTRIESGRFYPAEDYHQDYVRKHPHAAYVVVNDLPKLARLKTSYPGWWKA